jgi:hypothetical protein
MMDHYFGPFSGPIATREEFGEALQWLRRRHAAINGRPELSLREIAARTRGCVHNTIRNYLAGSTMPSPQALQRLLTIFEATHEQREFLVRARHDLVTKPMLLAASVPAARATAPRTVAVSALTGRAGCTDARALLYPGTHSEGGE